MTFTLSDQISSLLSAFVCGVVLGVIYDVFRFVRFLFSNSSITTFIFDFLFMLCFSFATLFFSMAYSFGKARFFVIVSEICGILSVRFTIGLFSLKILAYIHKKITSFFKKILIKSKKIAKKLLQPKHKMLYNKVKKDCVSVTDTAKQ